MIIWVAVTMNHTELLGHYSRLLTCWLLAPDYWISEDLWIPRLEITNADCLHRRPDRQLPRSSQTNNAQAVFGRAFGCIGRLCIHALQACPPIAVSMDGCRSCGTVDTWPCLVPSAFEAIVHGFVCKIGFLHERCFRKHDGCGRTGPSPAWLPYHISGNDEWFIHELHSAAVLVDRLLTHWC